MVRLKLQVVRSVCAGADLPGVLLPGRPREGTGGESPGDDGPWAGLCPWPADLFPWQYRYPRLQVSYHAVLSGWFTEDFQYSIPFWISTSLCDRHVDVMICVIDVSIKCSKDVNLPVLSGVPLFSLGSVFSQNSLAFPFPTRGTLDLSSASDKCSCAKRNSGLVVD